MTGTVWFCVAIGLEVIGLVGMACTVYGYSREVEDLRAERDADYAELAHRLDALTPAVEPATGPISLLDRPTSAQVAAPTVPDLEAQHPAPNAENYGRHAHQEAAA